MAGIIDQVKWVFEERLESTLKSFREQNMYIPS